MTVGVSFLLQTCVSVITGCVMGKSISHLLVTNGDTRSATDFPTVCSVAE